MASTVFSCGVILLVTVPSTASDPDHKNTTARSGGEKNVERRVDVGFGDRDDRRPVRLAEGPQRSEARLPRRTRRDIADEPPRLVDDEPPEIQSDAPRRATPPASTDDRKTIVIRLSHVPAVDTTETITKWLLSEEKLTHQAAATVVAVVISNDLVVSGSAGQLRSIAEIVRELDRPKPQIHVKAMLVDVTLHEDAEPALDDQTDGVSQSDLGEIVAKLKARGEVRVLAQSELLCGNNQPAFLQYGARVPRVTGTSAFRGSRVRQTTQENVGTMLAVTSRVADNDLVTLEIDLERSHLGPEDEGTAVETSEDGTVVRTPQVKTLTLQTTVSLRSGQTVVLGGMVYRDAERAGELMLVIQPEIVARRGR